jgi:uncharacterized membrane protein
MTSLTPLLAVHVTAALSAVVLGPFALWARLGMTQRPKLHRAFGYAWVSMMLLAASTALFLRSTIRFQAAGFSPIHLLIPVTFFSIFGAFWYLAKGNIQIHKRIMQNTYFWACLFTGAMTLLPGRLMNHWVFG